MTGLRFFLGVLVMGIAVPITIFLLLGLHTLPQLFTIAAVTFMSWGMCDLLAAIVTKPRLQGRTPGKAIKEDWERRTNDEP